MPDVSLKLDGSDAPYTVIVEPWACPAFDVRPGERCELVVHHPRAAATFAVSVARGCLVVWVAGSGCTFTFVRDGVAEFAMPVATI